MATYSMVLKRFQLVKTFCTLVSLFHAGICYCRSQTLHARLIGVCVEGLEMSIALIFVLS